MKIALAADHEGFELKQELKAFLSSQGYQLADFGAYELDSTDDYPDFVIPMAKAVAAKEFDRGIAVCGSGIGASVAANKVKGARAALVTDHFSAHQGVEDDDLNILCLGGRVVGVSSAKELVTAFLSARFTGEDRHERRLKKVRVIEENGG